VKALALEEELQQDRQPTLNPRPNDRLIYYSCSSCFGTSSLEASALDHSKVYSNDRGGGREESQITSLANKHPQERDKEENGIHAKPKGVASLQT